MLTVAAIIVVACVFVLVTQARTPRQPRVTADPRPGDLITYTRLAGIARAGHVHCIVRGVIHVRFDGQEGALVKVSDRGAGRGQWQMAEERA